MMTLARSLRILGLKHGSGMEEVRKAFRIAAFKYHPDLNPDNPRAAAVFREVNEAYVFLRRYFETGGKAGGRTGETFRRKPGYRAPKKDDSKEKAGEKTSESEDAGPAREEGSAAGTGTEQKTYGPTDKDESAARERPKWTERFSHHPEDVLRDILNDPFARRIYEDIYSSTNAGAQPPPPAKSRGKAGDGKTDLRGVGFVDVLKTKLLSLLDFEQTIAMSPRAVYPGAKIKVTISRAWPGENSSIEVILPRDYIPGRTIRLKGQGYSLGGVKGDLYLRLVPATEENRD